MGLQAIAPQIALGANGLWRPISSSPAVNAGTAITAVTNDMDGQPRVGAFDIGADEASAAITRVPLSADDVGPSWESAVER